MTTQVKDIVPVGFTIATPTYSTESTFSIAMAMAEVTDTDERVQTFSSADAGHEVYAATTELGKFITNFFGQSSKVGARKPDLLKVGKKLSDQNCIQSVTFDVDATAGTFTLSLGAVASSAIAYDAATGAVETAIESITGITSVTVTLNTGATQAGDKEGFTIEFDGADALTDFAALTADVASLTSVTTGTVTKTHYGSAVETWGTCYAALKAADPDFLFILPVAKFDTISEVDTLPSLVSTDSRILLLLSDNDDIIGSGSSEIASELLALSYENTGVLYSDDVTYPHAAEMGATIPDFFGSVNAAYYPLTGVVGSTLTGTAITNLVAKNCNRIETVGSYTAVQATSAGLDGSQGLISASGQYLEKVWAKYYLNAMVSEAVYALLISSKKIPATQLGLNMVKSVIQSTLQTKGVDNDILEEGSIVITMPAVSSITGRWLSGITADGGLQDAISKISITGNLI